jgi:hypothetical protein
MMAKEMMMVKEMMMAKEILPNAGVDRAMSVVRIKSRIPMIGERGFFRLAGAAPSRRNLSSVWIGNLPACWHWNGVSS